MADQRDLHARLAAALADRQRLQNEVQRLKEILAEHDILLPDSKKEHSEKQRRLPSPGEVAKVGTLTDNHAKITLLRSLFRGREDVYAERWRTKDWTWAYRPAGQRNWLAVLASRPEDHKRVDRETRTLYPITDEV